MSSPSEDPWAKEPVVPTPPGQAEPAQPGSDAGNGAAAPEGRRKRRKHHAWYWWLANLMIVAGVLVGPGYFLGTCACTAIHQGQLEEQLAATSPQITAIDAALNSADFYSYASTTTSTTLAPDTGQAEIDAAQAAIAAAKAERDARLAAFKAAADAFAATVGGKIGEPIGKILIPSIGVDVIMVEGTGVRDLKEGPGHWEETPFPGEVGNFVVSGHRTTYGAPFFKLDKVKPGDEIDLILPYAVCKYTVTETLIVYPDEVDTVAQAGREQVSLAACHPIYSAKQRIVVKGELSSFRLLETTAP